MTRRIAIVGAGQSGSLLALALLRDGHQVTLITDRDAATVRSGPVMSSQCMFGSALGIETELSEDDLHEAAPAISSMSIAVGSGAALIGRLDTPARSVDQRRKCADWMEEFTALGGQLQIERVDRRRLEDIAAAHELTVVATGKGELADLFDIDPARTIFTSPERVLTMCYVTGLADSADGGDLTMTILPGVGECLTIPALTTSGPCHIILIEAVPGGPLDVAVSDDPDHRLAHIAAALGTHFPQVANRVGDIALTDPGATLHGEITPTVRRPVATLANGRRVLGIADVVVLNDPITGQGSNNAVHAAHVYHQAIGAIGGKSFDEAWMRRTFEKYWRGWGQWSTAWTNSLLTGFDDHLQEVFAEAATLDTVADAVVRGFDDPRTVAGWWFTRRESERMIEAARLAAKSVHSRRALRQALGQYATGVTVITAMTADGQKIGFTANSFTSVSLDPPLVSFCPSRSAASLTDLTNAGRFAVNILAADQHDLSRQFATPAPDKFAGVAHRPGIGGTPLLDDVVAQFDCRTIQRVDAGDHVIFVGEVEEFTSPGGEPLVFHAGGYRLVTTHPEYPQ